MERASQVRISDLLRRVQFILVIGIGAAQALAAATPSFTIAASNVTVPGQGSASGQFTLTSVNGFTGQVGVTCTGPDSNLLPDLVLPSCDHPVQNYTIPANGSVAGTMGFYPPWVNGYGLASPGR